MHFIYLTSNQTQISNFNSNQDHNKGVFFFLLFPQDYRTSSTRMKPSLSESTKPEKDSEPNHHVIQLLLILGPIK